jgi:hypothetical protein
MVHDRRSRVAGGTYFFTVNLRDRRAHWLHSTLHWHMKNSAFTAGDVAEVFCGRE